MAKGGGFKSWINNSSKSVAYTALDLSDNHAPFITGTIKSAASLAKEGIDWLRRNNPSKDTNTSSDPIVRRVANSTKNVFKAALEDIKTGDINFSRLNSKLDNSFGDMDMDFDFSVDDFGDDTPFDSSDTGSDDMFSDASDSTPSFSGLTEDSYMTGVQIAAKSNIDAAQVMSSNISTATVTAVSGATDKMIAANFTNTARISSQIDSLIGNNGDINRNMASMVEFNHDTMSPFISQVQQHMENQEQTMNDIKAILETRLKEIADNNSTPSGYVDNSIVGRNGINFKNILKRVGNTTYAQLGLMAAAPALSLLQSFGIPMPDSIKEITQMAGGIEFSPLKFAAKTFLPSIFGNDARNKSGILDTIIRDRVTSILKGLANSSGMDEFTNLLRDVLGVNTGFYSVNASGYKKDATPWSGKDQQALREVIPGYLANINSTLSSLNEIVEKQWFTSDAYAKERKAYDEERQKLERNKVAKSYGEYANALKPIQKRRDELTEEVKELDAQKKKNEAFLKAHADDGDPARLEEIKADNKRIATRRKEIGNERRRLTNQAKELGDSPLRLARNTYTPVNLTAADKTRQVNAKISARKASREASVASFDYNTGKFRTKTDYIEDIVNELDMINAPFRSLLMDLDKRYEIDNDDKEYIADVTDKFAKSSNAFDAKVIVDEIFNRIKYNGRGDFIPDPVEEPAILTAKFNAAKDTYDKKRQTFNNSYTDRDLSYYKISEDQFNAIEPPKITFKDPDELTKEFYKNQLDNKYITSEEYQNKMQKLEMKKNIEAQREKAATHDADYYDEMNDPDEPDENASLIDKAKYKLAMAKRQVERKLFRLGDNKADKVAADVQKQVMQKILGASEAIATDPEKAIRIADEVSKSIKETAGNIAATGVFRVQKDGENWKLHAGESVLTPTQAEYYDKIINGLISGDIIPIGNFKIDRSKMAIDSQTGKAKTSLNMKESKYFDSISDAVRKGEFIFKHGNDIDVDQLGYAYRGVHDDDTRKELLDSIVNNAVNGMDFTQIEKTNVSVDRDSNGKVVITPTKNKSEARKNAKNISEPDDIKADTPEEYIVEQTKVISNNITEFAANFLELTKDMKDDDGKYTPGTISKLANMFKGLVIGDKNTEGYYTGPAGIILNKAIEKKNEFKHKYFGTEYRDLNGEYHIDEDARRDISSPLYVSDWKEGLKRALFGDDYGTNSNTPMFLLTDEAKKARRIEKNQPKIDKLTEEINTDKKWVEEYYPDARKKTIDRLKEIQDINTDGSLDEEFNQLSAELTWLDTHLEAAKNSIDQNGKDIKALENGEDVKHETEEAVGQLSKVVDKSIKGKLKRAGKAGAIGAIGSATLGSSLGVIPSLFLPGGPIGGAILGVATSLLSETEVFQRFMFGEEQADGSRTGGIISEKMRRQFNRAMPFVVGGATLGLMKKMFLPAASLPGPLGWMTNIFFGSGPVAGAIVGLAGGLLANSESFREKLFGTEDDDGRLEGGLLSKPTQALRDFYTKNVKYVKGAGAGLLATFLTKKYVQAKGAGLLYGLLGGNGLIGTAIIGSALGIMSQTNRFQDYLFGTDTGFTDENGKKIREKNGLINRFQSMFEVNVIRPVKDWAEYAKDSFASWVKNDIIGNFKDALSPLKKAFAHAGEEIDDTFDGFGTKLFKFLNVITHPISKLLPLGLKWGTKAGLGMLTGAAKVTGALTTLPLSIAAYLANGSPLFGNVGHDRKLNRDFARTIYGNRFKSWMGYLFHRRDWLDKRQQYADDPANAISEDDPFLFLNRRRSKKAGMKEINDAYKKRKGITKVMQKWASKDKFNVDIQLDDDEFNDRLAFLNRKGVDTNGWTQSDLVAFMYDNDKKKEQRDRFEAEKAAALKRETENNENIKNIVTGVNTIADAISPGAKVLPESSSTENTNADVVSGAAKVLQESESTDSEDEVIDTDNESSTGKKKHKTKKDRRKAKAEKMRAKKQRKSEVTRKSELAKAGKTGDLVNVDPNAPLTASNVQEAVENATVNVNGMNKAADDEKARKKAAYDKTMKSQSGAFKKDSSKGVMTRIADSIKSSGDNDDDDKSTFSQIFTKISEVLGIAALGIAAVKIPWGKVIGAVTGTIGKIGDSIRSSSEEGRTYVDEDGNIQIDDSILSAKGSSSYAAKAMRNLFGGHNLRFMTGGLKGSGGLLRRAGNAVANSTAKLAGSGARAINETVTKKLVQKAASTSVVSDLFERLSKSALKLADSKAVTHTLGEKLSRTLATKVSKWWIDLSTKYGVKLGKYSGKLADAITKSAAKGTAESAAKTGSKAIPVVGIILTGVDAITGAIEAANLFYVNEEDVNFKMRIVSMIFGVFMGFGIMPLIECVNDVIAEFTNLDIIHELAVFIYNIIANQTDKSDLKAAMNKFDNEWKLYNEENGTDVSKATYNDQVANQSWMTKFFNIFKGNTETTYKTHNTKEAAEYTKQRRAAYNGKQYVVSQTQTTNISTSATVDGAELTSSDSEGYGSLYDSIGYGSNDHFTQNDPRWASKQYGRRRNGRYTTMASGGCGPTALANVATQLGVNTNPAQVANMARHSGYTSDGGTNARMFTAGARRLGLKSSNIGRGGIRGALKRGNKVVISGRGADGIYSRAGHIISARGLDSHGNALVDDPLRRGTRHIPLSKLTEHANHAWSLGYGADITLDEANERYGIPMEYSAPQVDGGFAPFYMYPQNPSTEVAERNWGNVKFGSLPEGIKENSTADKRPTIGKYGCFLTGMSTLYSNYTGRDFDPATTARLFQSAFSENGDLKTGLIDGGSQPRIVEMMNMDLEDMTGDASVPFVIGANIKGNTDEDFRINYYEPDTQFKTWDEGNYQWIYIRRNLDHDYNGSGPSKQAVDNACALLSVPNPHGDDARKSVYGSNGKDTRLVRDYTKYGLSAGRPVLMHGYPGGIYGDHEHTVIIKGVKWKKVDDTWKPFIHKFDPGSSSTTANNIEIPLEDVINADNMKRTKYIVGFSEARNLTDNDELQSYYKDYTAGVGSSVQEFYTGTTGSSLGFVDGVKAFAGGLGQIASNVLAGIGSEGWTYNSIYDNGSISLLGGNGFNESLGKYTNKYSLWYDPVYYDPSSSDYDGSAINASTSYGSLVNRLKGTYDSIVSRAKASSAWSGATPHATVSSDLSLKSNRLGASTLSAMANNIMAMIASHESAGEFTTAYNDTNDRLAFGIGGFNGANAAEVLYRIVNGINYYSTEDPAYLTSLGIKDKTDCNNIIYKLEKYAETAPNRKFNQSELKDLSNILERVSPIAEDAEVSALEDLAYYYMQKPLKRYDANDLKDPRSVMLLSEFGGFRPAAFNDSSSLWTMIRSKKLNQQTDLKGVYNSMLNYYPQVTSYFSTGHRNRITETYKSLVDSSLGFTPSAIIPGGPEGIALDPYGGVDTSNMNWYAKEQIQQYVQNNPDGSVGMGTGNSFYSDSDIYTDMDSISSNSVKRSVRVDMDTSNITSRMDVMIQLLRTIVQQTVSDIVSEGYGGVTNTQKEIPKTTKSTDTKKSALATPSSINQNYIDPIRKTFMAIAASPR